MKKTLSKFFISLIYILVSTCKTEKCNLPFSIFLLPTLFYSDCQFFAFLQKKGSFSRFSLVVLKHLTEKIKIMEVFRRTFSRCNTDPALLKSESVAEKRIRFVFVVYFALVLDNVLLTVVGMYYFYYLPSLKCFEKVN